MALSVIIAPWAGSWINQKIELATAQLECGEGIPGDRFVPSWRRAKRHS